MREQKTRTFARRVGAIALRVVAGIMGLILMALLVLQIPAVQSYIAQKAVSLISSKTHSRIEVGSVSIAFTHSLVLHNVYVEDRQGDTLVSVQTLAVDVNLLGLFSHAITFHNLRIDSLTAHITHTMPDSTFNFGFILDSLASGSTSDSPPDSSAGAGWEIRPGNVSLNGIHVTYDDAVSGSNVHLQIGSLGCSFEEFHLDKMQIRVDKISIENTIASVAQTKETPRADSTSSDVDFGFRALSIAQTHVKYENSVTRERFSVDVGKSMVTAETVDLPSRHVALKEFMLDDTHMVIAEPKKNGKTPDEGQVHDKSWVFSLDDLNLRNSSLQYDIQGVGEPRGLDPHHLRLDGLTMRAANLFFGDHRIKGDLIHASFRDHSGLDVHEISGGFIIDSLHAQLTDVTVETAASRIRQNLLLQYASIAALKTLRSDVIVSSTLEDSHIAISDLLLFQPSLPVRNKAGATIRMAFQVSGRVGDLKLTDCRIATGDSTRIDLTGSIRGLPEAATAYVDVNLHEFSTSRTDIRALVADTVLPRNLVLPATLTMTGQFRGTTKQFFTSASIATSDGSISGNALFHSEGKPNAQTCQWKAEVSVAELNLGSLLNDPETLGPVTLYASVAGTGLSKDDIQAKMNVEVEKAVVHGYPYRHLSISGTAGPQLFEGKAEINDSNIVFTFDGTVNTSEEDPVYKFRFDLQGANLQRLRLTMDDVRVSGVITSDLTGQNIDDLNGAVDVRHVLIIKNRRRYMIDSLRFASVNNEKETHISIESDLLSATFDGTIALGELPSAFEEHFERYFSRHDTLVAKGSKPQAFTFQVSLRDPRIFTEVFFPQLDRLTTGVIAGHYDSKNMDLTLTADIPTAGYGGFDIDSVTLNVTSDPQRLQATLRVGSVSDSMLVLTNLQLGGIAQHDSIAAALQSLGGNGETKLLLAGGCTSVPNGYRWRFLPEGIVFRGTRWSVPPDNYIVFGSGRVLAHEVVLRDKGQSVTFSGDDGAPSPSALTLTLAGFELATLSRIVERDSGLIGGVLNGNVVLRRHDKQLAVTSDINVSDFTFARRVIGDIVARVNNRAEDLYEVDVDIRGNDNDITAKGQYRNDASGGDLSLTCDLKKVNLGSVEPWTFGTLRRLSGSASGTLNVTGTAANPTITGNIAFNNTAFDPAILGSYWRVNDGRIIVDRAGVHFGSFELVDTLGNTASLTGSVFTNDFRNFNFGIHVSTTKFLLMNRPASRDALYYGTVFLDSDISVEGDYAQPIIRMQAKLDKGTDLAFVLPESETDVQHRYGIVRFLDVKNPLNPIMSRRTTANRRAHDSTGLRRTSIDLTADLEVNKESKLRILIDPIAGDSLVIRGEATFSVSVDASGKLAVTGRYDILDGSYQLSFGQFIRREFAIAKGSSLTWYGSVTEANVDITAIYTAKASVMDLVQDQLAGLSQEEQNKYKQALHIQVYLSIDGKLLAPNIHFRLDLPPDERGALGGSIYAKLNEINGQESELNKQVFALLVLGRFISSNPLASASDGGLSGLARSSVSQILTEQLNRLSEKVIPGVGLNVGVESYQDYSSGTAEGRTQLQVALTKQLFDERVTVQVGGNADLEGQRSQQNALNNFAGDIKVGYKMTDDGRWVLQVFRQNTNAGAIEGDLVETGVGIVFAIDYDKLFGLGLTPVEDKEENK